MEVETAACGVNSRVGTRIEKAGRRMEDHAVLQVGEEMPSITPETAAIGTRRGYAPNGDKGVMRPLPRRRLQARDAAHDDG